MGLMDALRNPDIWQYVGNVGAGINRAAGGQPFDISGANAGLAQANQQRQMQRKIGGLMDGMGLTEAQRQLVGAMPPEAALSVLARHQFAGPSSEFDQILSQLSPGDRELALRIKAGLAPGATSDQTYFAPQRVYNPETEEYQFVQFGNRGGVNVPQLPEGVTVPRAGTSRVDQGTHWAIIDDATGNVVGTLPKNAREAAAEEAAGRVEGTTSAEKKVDAPRALSQAEGMLAAIRNVKNDPALPRMVGPVEGRLPNVSGEAARFESKLQQLQGKTFLTAYETLKGGGQITEIEGQKAERAMARIETAQDDQDFVDALSELEEVVSGAISRLRGEGGEKTPSPFSNVAFDFTPDEIKEIQTAPAGSVVDVPGVGRFVWDGRGLSAIE